MPARRAVEHDQAVIAGWVKEAWPQVEGPWRRSTPGSFSRTKPDRASAARRPDRAGLGQPDTHSTAKVHRYIAERDWLAVYQLPPYAPDLNPVAGIWSVPRRTTTANRGFRRPVRPDHRRPPESQGSCTVKGS
ncbi:transposase [Streptomyces sp. CA-251387]|uniref:transposase n=1 Tax=Streptomyces sp. CA-251387 TaxID=3240064 RepID=UPI003D93AE21